MLLYLDRTVKARQDLAMRIIALCVVVLPGANVTNEGGDHEYQ